jgi:2'-5' RNA ligase
MRLFVAIDASDVVMAAATTLIDQLRTRARDLAPRARITWVPPSRLHVTVRFLGEVAAEVLPDIEQALSAPFAMEPFSVTFGGLEAFPPRGAPRAVWIGVTAGRDALLEIERQVSARLEQVGVAGDSHPYRPHLTLARVRDARGLYTADLVRDLVDASLGTMRVTRTTLIESHLLPAGPNYLPRRETTCGGPATAVPEA